MTIPPDGQAIQNIPYSRAFTQYYIGTQEGAGKMYPWFHEQAVDEGHRNLTNTARDDPACPYMSLTRSTWVGGQRFCTYLWSGDTRSEWATLSQQVTAGASVAASGISSWTLDIGGFAGLNVDREEDRELFVRWFGFGTFLPYVSTRWRRRGRYADFIMNRCVRMGMLIDFRAIRSLTIFFSDRDCNLTRPTNQSYANPCPNEVQCSFLVMSVFLTLSTSPGPSEMTTSLC